MLQSSTPSIENRSSWLIATMSVFILSISFGAPWLVTVGLKTIAAEMGGARSVPSLAVAIAWFGAAIGGIGMGRLAERVGVRTTAILGSISIGIGLVIASTGGEWALYVGYGLFVGVLGISGINAPLMVYVSHWFDRRRGSALALISSGTYVAGTVWPLLFERAIAYMGWRQAMLWLAAFQLLTIIPLAIVFLRRPPELPIATASIGVGREKLEVLGWPPRFVFISICVAVFLCCITMSMPQQHLVAFCSDLGMAATTGALMVSVLLGVGVIGRQVWGLISDRIGGLTTVLIGSTSQAIAMSGFLMTQSEAGLFAVAAAFGIGFSGLIPAYVLAVRELFPASEASWRIPVLLLASGSGMAGGGWLAGVLYDVFGSYGPAFMTGILFNAANLVVIGMLVGRQTFIAARA